MSFPCSVCAHAQVEAISSAILSRTPLRNIASRFPGTTKSALGRHRKHVAGSIVKAVARIPIPRVEPAEIERFEDSLLAKVSRLEKDARRLGERAESEGDLRAALVAVDKLLDVARLLHELMPVDSSAPAVKISFSFPHGRSAWDASGEVAGATEPVPELQAPVTGIELQVPASGITEIVVSPEVETEEAKFVREGFEKLDRLREQDARDEVHSALIQPDYEPRRGGF
jgi:hypothetical protein